ncbi:MAG TPA: sigma-70 family RNA polymerase sigma factor [Chitinophagaceae bacterium]|nr:sigma-70 family RNA polymerase sigma factor [Chitinophagaceae bacterium]
MIQNIQAGDAQAFASLVHLYKDPAVSLAYSILLNQEDAEETAQDAFVKAYTSLHTFKGHSRFATWFYRIVVNTALNKHRLKKWEKEEITEAIEMTVPGDMENILAAQITADHKKQIQTALHALPANERLCLTLFYLQEMTVTEIAETTGLTASNIKVLLHRGRKNLYAALYKQLKTELTNFI